MRPVKSKSKTLPNEGTLRYFWSASASKNLCWFLLFIMLVVSRLNDIARLNLGEGVGSKLRRNSLDRVPMRRKSSLAGKEGM